MAIHMMLTWFSNFNGCIFSKQGLKHMFVETIVKLGTFLPLILLYPTNFTASASFSVPDQFSVDVCPRV
jgi:hypothetical protein